MLGTLVGKLQLDEGRIQARVLHACIGGIAIGLGAGGPILAHRQAHVLVHIARTVLHRKALAVHLAGNHIFVDVVRCFGGGSLQQRLGIGNERAALGNQRVLPIACPLGKRHANMRLLNFGHIFAAEVSKG